MELWVVYSWKGGGTFLPLRKERKDNGIIQEDSKERNVYNFYSLWKQTVVKIKRIRN